MSTAAQMPRTPAPASLWNSNRLVSLFEIMDKFTASNCCEAFALMGQYAQAASLSPPHSEVDPSELKRLSIIILLPVIYLSDELRLKESRKSAARLNDEFENSHTSPMTSSELLWKLNALRELVESEMKQKIVLSIPDDLAVYYQQNKPLGNDVYDSFPSARFDLTEASTCLACGNNVASAFHMMRVAEIGLRELGRDRQIPLAKSGKVDFTEWGKIIGELEVAVQAIQQWPNSHIKDEAQKFYNKTLQEIRSFNDGWRRHAVHARPSPEMETDEAIALWGHTSRFIRKLATKISEGNYTPLIWT